jgi:succinate dehydrogenase / fumarate reductase membrane anchor subunit
MSRRATGLRAWTLQRISAIYLLLFSSYLIGLFAVSPPASFEQWRDWVSAPVVSLAILVFFLALLVHSWVGIRDVLIDYVHPLALRVTLLSLFGFGLTACGLWAMRVVFVAQMG